MLRVTSMTRYQAFRWLWRFDNDAKWFWSLSYLKGSNLIDDVKQNFSDFGVRNFRGDYVKPFYRSF